MKRWAPFDTVTRHWTKSDYGPHLWGCPACAEAADERKARRLRENPHRPGTKAYIRWDQDHAASDWGLDLRSETYWSS